MLKRRRILERQATALAVLVALQMLAAGFFVDLIGMLLIPLVLWVAVPVLGYGAR